MNYDKLRIYLGEYYKWCSLCDPLYDIFESQTHLNRGEGGKFWHNVH